MADGTAVRVTECPLHGTKAIIPYESRKIDPLTGAEEIVLNSRGGQCLSCLAFNNAHGRARPQPKREPGPPERERYEHVGDFDPEDFKRWLMRLEKDPARFAAFMADARRPKGVSRERHGVALRRAIREPMLNADPRAVREGLLYDKGSPGHLPKGKPFRYLLVKPAALATAKLAGGWHSREWVVFTLKYAKGLVIVTEKGRESKVFPGFGSMREAIIGSGWEIIR